MHHGTKLLISEPCEARQHVQFMVLPPQQSWQQCYSHVACPVAFHHDLQHYCTTVGTQPPCGYATVRVEKYNLPVTIWLPVSDGMRCCTQVLAEQARRVGISIEAENAVQQSAARAAVSRKKQDAGYSLEISSIHRRYPSPQITKNTLKNYITNYNALDCSCNIAAS